jgi:glycosyltransferase involved in cell wall biosynthesis
MKIAIAGTRGIPNQYGGFEQCAEYLSVILAGKGHEVIVYNVHDHSYTADKFNAVTIVHKYNPEKTIGTIGNFFYDLSCMKHAIKAGCDVLLVLGYTTASVFYRYLDFKKTVLITNMDGLEWQRDKWNTLVKKIARHLEKLGAMHSHFLVADNPQISAYLAKTYHKNSEYIAYGCFPFLNPKEEVLKSYQLTAGEYGLIIARMEAENNIAMMLEAFAQSKSDKQLLVIGNLVTEYGRKLAFVYKKYPNIKFMGGIYDLNVLNNLRFYSGFYLHGHSVGGTNPSLLEAMASKAFIIAHDNPFNRAVTGPDALYFSNVDELRMRFNQTNGPFRESYISNNFEKIVKQYNWDVIASKYESMFQSAVKGLIHNAG